MFKKIISLGLGAMLALSSLAYAADGQLEVSVSGGAEAFHGSSGYDKEDLAGNPYALTDGDATTTYGCFSGDSGWSNASKYKQWVALDLAASYSITKVELTPALDLDYGTKFPKRFKIEVSDSADFSAPQVFYDNTGSDYYAAEAPTEVQSFSGNAEGRYIRVYATENGDYYSNEDGSGKHYYATAFAEFEVFCGASVEKVQIQKAVKDNTKDNSPANAPNLIDGSLDTVDAVTTGDSGWSNETKYQHKITLDLGESRDIVGMNLYPVLKAAGSMFPKQFEIQVSDSADFETYTVAYKAENDYYTDYEFSDWKDTSKVKEPTGPSEMQTLSFTASGRYVRIYVTKSGTYSYQTSGAKGFFATGFKEIEVLANPKARLTKVTPASASAWSDRSGVVDASALYDGDTSKGTSVDNGDASWAKPEQYPCWFAYDLGEVCELAEVKLYPIVKESGSVFPLRFEIQISNDGENYASVYTQSEDYFDENSIPASAQSFLISGNARYIRVYVTKNSAYYTGGKGYYRTGFAEIEVYSGTKYQLENTYTSNGEEISSLDGAESVSVNTRVINNTGAVSSGVAIYTLMYDGVLTDSRFVPVVLNPETDLPAQVFTLGNADKSKYSISVYLWDGIENIRPYCNNTVFPK